MPVILEAKDLEQRERGEAKDAASLMKPVGEDILLTVAGVEAGKTAYEW